MATVEITSIALYKQTFVTNSYSLNHKNKEIAEISGRCGGVR